MNDPNNAETSAVLMGLRKGVRVRLHSLEQRTDLNGTEGTVVTTCKGDLSKAVVKLDANGQKVKIPYAKLTPLDQECPICYETTDVGLLAFFPCGHGVCNDCMDVHVIRGRIHGQAASCPMCRAVPTELPLQIIPVFDQGDDLCFVYTDGFFRRGFPEILFVDVPIPKIETVGMVVECVKQFYYDVGKEIVHGHKFGLHGIKAQFLTVTNTVHHNQIMPLLGSANPVASFVIVKPRDEEMDPAGEWGTDPAAPEGEDDMREHIGNEWIRQMNCSSTGLARARCLTETRGFTRFADASREEVVGEISIVDVFGHPEWEVDWDALLTPDEVAYVRRNWNRVLRYFFSFIVRFPDLNRLERYTQNIAGNAHDAQGRYHRGEKLADDPSS